MNTTESVSSVLPIDGLHHSSSVQYHQKFVVITGGTLSGVGKGSTISCIGVILQSMGFTVSAIKIDPYLNVDAGTMSPYEHGEVYVLEDGGEVDLDLGNYERFLDIRLTKDHNITTGKIYEKVLRDERAGRYLGQTVQVVPHTTDAIQEWILSVAQKPVEYNSSHRSDICLIEVGGTVGDIEGLCYLEALQQLYMKVGEDNFSLCHVSYIPEIGTGSTREQKTKPTQHSIKELRRLGLRPDFVFCRSENPLSSKAKDKIALFGQVPLRNVIDLHNLPNIYFGPELINQQNFGLSICRKLNLIPSQKYLQESNQSFAILSPSVTPLIGKPFPKTSVKQFEKYGERILACNRVVEIGIVGKYTGSADSYLSVVKALQHAALRNNVYPKIRWIDSSRLEDSEDKEIWYSLSACHGILCPGGFGDRGIIGKIVSSKFCREHKVPYLGICLGMQTAVIDFCRSELGLTYADSEEFNKESPDKVVVFMPETHPVIKGGTMRLGNRATIIRDSNSLAYRIYGNCPVIYERHRHRYEINTLYVPAMEAKGLRFVGQDEKGQRMEIAELENHPFFLLTQFHPEFTSRIHRPNPCFLEFIRACAERITDSQ